MAQILENLVQNLFQNLLAEFLPTPVRKTIRGLGPPDPDSVFARGFSLNKLFTGWVHKIQILIRETLEDFLRNFFGEEMGGVRGDPGVREN